MSPAAALYTDNMMDNDLLLVILAIISAICVMWTVIVQTRARKANRILRGIVESRQETLLFYDENDRLAFRSAGLILFNKGSLRDIRKLTHRPLPDREVVGELTIDGNRYRSRSKLLQYRPGVVGTIVYLEYVGPESASR